MSEVTLEQAAESLLPQPEVEAEAEDTTQDVEVETEEEETEVEATQPEVEEEDGEEVEYTDETDEPEDEKDDDYEAQQLIPVKVDGEEVEVTLDDLKRSFSGQGKIQKGMQEAAEMRKQSEEVFNTLRAEQEKFIATVQALQAQGLKSPPQAPDEKMVETDPIGYIQDKAKYDKEMAEYQSQQQEIQRVQQQQTAMNESQHKEYLAQQARLAQEKVPELADPKVAEKFKNTLMKTGMEAYGFTGEEMSSIMDARAVAVLSDAYRWRELQSSKAKAKKEPPAPRNIKPSAKRQVPKNLARKKLIAQAKKSGKIEDFASLLLNNG